MFIDVELHDMYCVQAEEKAQKDEAEIQVKRPDHLLNINYT